jgi:hypothetical protein
MKDALKAVQYGVRQYMDGKFRCVDEPDKSINKNTLQALADRGLITWRGLGGATHQHHIELTDLGRDVLEGGRGE